MNSTPLTWGEYARLRPAQIDTIRERTPVAYVPWGALEWHSYHAPIGLDGLKAEGLCKALAEAYGGVVLPPFFVGTDTIKPFKGFKHTLDHTESTVCNLMDELLEQLIDEGFRVIVVLTGHYGGRHVACVKQTTEAVGQRHPEVGIIGMPEYVVMEDVSPSNHAAFDETSFMMAIDEETVDLGMVPDPPPTLDEDGVLGRNPAEATTRDGRRLIELFVERMRPQMTELIERHAG